MTEKKSKASKAKPKSGGDKKASGVLNTKADMPAPLPELRLLCRRRKELQRTRIAIVNNLSAYARSLLGFQVGMKETERKKVTTKAGKIVNDMLEGKSPKHEIVLHLNFVLLPVAGAIHQSRKMEEQVSKDITKIVKAMPIWKGFCKGVAGVGELMTGQMIAEIGDPCNYSNPAKIWKRMGMHVFEGKACSTWRQRGGLNAEKWTAAGYNPHRMSLMYLVSESMMKQKKQGGEYRKLYETRKEFELKKEGITPIHAHKRALRYIGKRFLRNLWVEWNKLHGTNTAKAAA